MVIEDSKSMFSAGGLMLYNVKTPAEMQGKSDTGTTLSVSGPGSSVTVRRNSALLGAGVWVKDAGKDGSKVLVENGAVLSVSQNEASEAEAGMLAEGVEELLPLMD